MLDSAGHISLLDRFKRQLQARWVPLLDTAALAKKKGRTETYWPVGVTDKHLMCLILRVRKEFQVIDSKLMLRSSRAANPNQVFLDHLSWRKRLRCQRSTLMPRKDKLRSGESPAESTCTPFCSGPYAP